MYLTFSHSPHVTVFWTLVFQLLNDHAHDKQQRLTNHDMEMIDGQ